MHSPSQWFYAIVLVIALVALVEAKTRRRRLNLPPGPSPLPFIGNVLSMPRKHLGLELQGLCRKYGELVHLDVLGQHLVVISSAKAARDLLEKRSANYSDRVTSIMAKLTGLDRFLILENYGNKWRLFRRVLHQSFHVDAVERYRPIQKATAHKLIHLTLQSPKDVLMYTKFSFADLLMRVIYGVELGEENDSSFRLIEEVAVVSTAIAIPGNFPVEAVPALRYLPSWAPGGRFKKYAADAKVLYLHTLDVLFRGALDNIQADVGRDSFVSRLLETISPSDLQSGGSLDVETFTKDSAYTVYSAGADTTYHTIQAFFLAMAMYPDVQRKAQEELDRVVGSDRLPDFEDQHSLPYLNALIMELLRWHPVTPLGVPHRSVADDVYNGWHIPAGTTMVVNSWSLTRDPDVFPDADRFAPERFLDSDGSLDMGRGDPTDFVFGFGRRICPGSHFAQASLFILTASLLHVFNISPPNDSNGVPMKLEYNVSEAMRIISEVNTYSYDMKPRLQHAAELIREFTS